MKKTFTAFLTLLFIGTSGTTDLFAGDNYYVFKKANEQRALGDLVGASSLYQEYIKSHPLSNEPGLKRSALQNRQNLLRNLLSAFESMLEISRKESDLEKQDFWLEQLLALYQPEIFRSKNSYTFARILYENNRLDESILILEKIIDDQINDYWHGNIKVFLRTASKLSKIYTEQGNTASLEKLYNHLIKCVLEDFDTNDKYKLANLLLGYEKTKQRGNEILQNIVQNTTSSMYAKSAFLKSSMLLMVQQHKAKKDKELTKTILQIQKVIDDASPSALYKLAMTYYKIEEQPAGRVLLKDISAQFPDTIWARKSLFLLGRNALSEEDWNSAIEYFSAYIEKYPQQTFFCLKAYSNLLDAVWARDGNLREQQIDINQFADILNETSDYETHLNMARELQYKGYERLADATFTLGYTYAQQIIQENPHSLQAMRVNWQLSKYGYQLGKIDLAKECGESVIEQYTSSKNNHMGMDSRKRADHYLSRTYLWLAKAYSAQEKTKEAEDILVRFITEFPGDNDTDYATFQLAELYEQDLNWEKAAQQYKRINRSRWKEKAAKALKRLGSR